MSWKGPIFNQGGIFIGGNNNGNATINLNQDRSFGVAEQEELLKRLPKETKSIAMSYVQSGDEPRRLMKKILDFLVSKGFNAYFSSAIMTPDPPEQVCISKADENGLVKILVGV